jgi:multidrug efflux pump
VVTIPLSLVGVCTFLLLFGFSINLLTLLAMVLAIGLVVDDAIVVVENIHRHISEGKTAVEAALIGTREIASPILSMTITLVAVYAPIAFMGGLTGALFKEFALTLAGAVVLSGVIALTLSPMMCSKILTKVQQDNRFEYRVGYLFQRLTNAYKMLLYTALQHRKWILASTLFFFSGIAFFLKVIPKELAPREDQGFIFVTTKAPQSTNLDYLSAYAREVNHILSTQPENELSFVINGRDIPSSGIGITILQPWDQRQTTAMDMVPRLQMKLAQIPGIQAFAFQLPPLPGTSGMPVQFVISGMSHYEVLFDLINQLKTAAQKSGLFMVVDKDLEFNNPQLHLAINHSKANFLGVKMEDVGFTLALLMSGHFINRFNLEGRSYQVIPQVPREFRLYPDLLKEFYVRTAKGGLVPLSTFTQSKLTVNANQLFQFNQLNSATLSAILMPGTTMGKAIEFLENEARKILPRGFTWDYLSESRQYIQEGNALLITFIFAVIIIFLVLAAQFESFRDPFIIMFSVPLSLFGALLFLFLGYTTLNIYTQIGLVTLVGLITKHGILIVEFANHLQEQKKVNRIDAVIEAAAIRLRPVLMTTAAMVVGLIPLLTAHGAGSSSRFSLGLVIVTGMTIGTCFTLFVVPAFYSVFAKSHQ